MSLEQLDFKFVMQHCGSRAKFLKRYEQAAVDACGGSRKDYDRFCADLVSYAADERNLMSAVDHLRLNGGPAPGPDGRRLDEFSRLELWEAVRLLRDALRSGRYQRGPLRRCQIPKKPGSLKKRTIYLPGILDRIVTRGAAQILTPLLKSVVDPLSFCWTGRGGQRALAFARGRLIEEGRFVWLIEDARQAFDRVNRQRMSEVLRCYVPDKDFCELVMHLVEPPTKKGILQGSALSMLLLDLFLTHFIHRPWRKEDLPPLARYADDILVALRPEDDATETYNRLIHHFHNAGMEPKHGYQKAIVDIRHQTAQWLGYRLRWRHSQLEIHSKLFDLAGREQAEHTHAYIFAKFVQLHEQEEGWRRQNSLLRGMIAHLAPTLPFENAAEVYNRISEAAREAGFEELWPLSQVLAVWTSDYHRWLDTCERIIELDGKSGTSDQVQELCPADDVWDPSVAPF